jgi:hypothetical protein
MFLPKLSMRLVVAIILLRVTVGHTPTTCPPLLPTPEKLLTQHKFLHENFSAPLFFWHVQKAGGTSFCAMVKRTFHEVHGRQNVLRSPNCNNLKVSEELVTNATSWELKYKPQGYHYVAIEPSLDLFLMIDKGIRNPNAFPKQFHEKLSTQILLNDSYGARQNEAWNSMIHVLGKRFTTNYCERQSPRK